MLLFSGVNQGTLIDMKLQQGHIRRSRAKTLQVLITHIQDVVNSTNKVVADVGVLPYMSCKVGF